MYGDSRGVRTPDLYPVKVALSQLSYRINFFVQQKLLYMLFKSFDNTFLSVPQKIGFSNM